MRELDDSVIAIVFATPREAAPFIEQSGAHPINHTISLGGLSEFTLAGTASPALIAVSGMGRGKAAAAMTQLFASYDIERVINAGICGGLADSLPRGALVTVALAIDGDATGPGETHNDALHALQVWPGLPAARLATVAKPVSGGPRREMLATHADIVDMEGWDIARACESHGVPCTMIKAVSDGACENASADIAASLAPLSILIAGTLMTGLPRLHVKGNFLARLHRFTRLEHTIFSIPLLLAGGWIGAGYTFFGWRKVMLIMAVGAGGRTMGMALNRLFDRRLDALNPRTACRELPAGRLSVPAGYLVALGGLAVYLAGCLGLGKLCFYLSPVPLIPLLTYSLLKRLTNLCHFGIGICLGFAPLGAYVATAGALPFRPDILLLAGFTFFWISGFDIVYALQDMESDRNTGVRSLPVSLGARGSQLVAVCTHLVAWGLLAALWHYQGGGILAALALAVALVAFIAAYIPAIPLPLRFFPLSAIAGIAGAMVPLLKAAT